MKTLGTILLIGVAIYLAGCFGLYVRQASFIYFPPQAAAFDAPRTSILNVPGARVKVSERPAEGPKAVVYFGGNAEDVSASLPLLDLAFPEHALYLLHYRGFAGSSGTPSEAALVADALALADQVAALHSDVVVIGRSLGSAVAIQVASQRPVRQLVLVTPFDSLQELAALHFPYFPVRWLLRDKYESWRHAAQITAPTLLIAAEHDEIVPVASTKQLLSSFTPGVARMEVIAGVGHNTISDSPAYLRLLRQGNGLR